jgi:hypothetical protein
MDLLETPPQILDSMIRFVLGTAAAERKSDWERLNQEVL